MGQLFGEQHRALVDWLADGWWRGGPAVAAIQGFPGNGKTEVAHRAIEVFRAASPTVPVARFDCPESSSSLVGDLILNLAEELCGANDGEVLEAIDKGADPVAIFRRLLTRPRLIVIDEAQRLMAGPDGHMPAEVARVLEEVALTADPRGRLLLLSSREFADQRWKERAELVTLKPLRIKEAEAYLSEQLAVHDRSDLVPPERLCDVVQWLGGNARALRLLVSALGKDSLDFLIGLAPEGWEARDREVSPRLLREFEKNVLTRAEAHLDDRTLLFLHRIAVLRKPFPRVALEALSTGDIVMEDARDELLARYIIEFRTGYYHTHPIVRETVLSRSSDKQRRSAHLAAGNYFAKAFQARQMTGRPEALGARFVEARYHFTLADSESDLAKIAASFETHLRSQFSFTSRIPTDSQELDERIGLLSALLKDRGPHGLEYHLAKCLLARGRANDARLALPHLRRSTGPRSPAEAWVLRIRTEFQIHGLPEARKAMREGAEASPSNLFSLYQAAGEILAGSGEVDEAVALLLKGIEVVPVNQSVSSLYQAAGEILAGSGKADEAVVLLLKGIEVVPPTQNLFSLYQAAGEILARSGRADEALALLLKGIEVVPVNQSVSSLYQAAGEILAGSGKADEAVALLLKGIGVVPMNQSVSSLYHAAGKILAGSGKADEAVALLRKGIEVVPPNQNIFTLYHTAVEILVRMGRLDEANALLRQGVKVVPPAQSHSAIIFAADFDRFDLIDGVAFEGPGRLLLDMVTGIVAQDYHGALAKAEASIDLFEEYLVLVEQGMFAALAIGDTERARKFLNAHQHARPPEAGDSVAWLTGLMEFLDGNLDAARDDLRVYLGRELSSQDLSLDTFVEIWTASCMRLASPLSHNFPRLPPSLTGRDRLLIRHEVLRDAAAGVVAPTAEQDPAPGVVRTSVLLVCTEWSSAHGGLSTFNRQLSIAMAQEGLNVICLVPQASDSEKAEAAAAGVTLAVAATSPGLNDQQRLMRKPQDLGELHPDFIVGHGRVTGPAAEALMDHYPSARRLHFVHMAPDDIERHKVGRSDEAGVRAQHRTELEEDLGRTAHRLVAVGPRLHGRYSTLLAGYEGVPAPLRFDPGFDAADVRPRDPPAGDPWQVLVLARAEDAPLKGIDIASSALAAVVAERRGQGLEGVQLVIRGARAEDMANLRSMLTEEAEPGSLDLVLRTFTTSGERLQADMRRASLVLMPSRSEGFGLVGLEAIVAGAPVLVSQESGLGQLLKEILKPAQAAQIVVDMGGSDQAVKARWASHVGRVLANRDAAFGLAAEIREIMASHRTWVGSVRNLFAELEAEPS